MITILSKFEWKTHSRYRKSGASAPNVSVDISWATNEATNELCDFSLQVGTVSGVVNMEELPAPVFDPAQRAVTVGFYAGTTIQDLLTDLQMPFDGQSPTITKTALATPNHAHVFDTLENCWNTDNLDKGELQITLSECLSGDNQGNRG